MLLTLRKTLQFNDGVPTIRKKKQTKVEKNLRSKTGKHKKNLLPKFYDYDANSNSTIFDRTCIKHKLGQ